MVRHTRGLDSRGLPSSTAHVTLRLLLLEAWNGVPRPMATRRAWGRGRHLAGDHASRALLCICLHSCRAAHGPRLPVLQGGRRDMERGGLSQDTSGKLGPQVGTQRLQPQARHVAGGRRNGPDRPTPRAKCEQLRGWRAKPTGLWSAPH